MTDEKFARLTKFRELIEVTFTRDNIQQNGSVEFGVLFLIFCFVFLIKSEFQRRCKRMNS